MKQKNVLWNYLKLLGKRFPLYATAIVGMTVFGALFDVIGSLLMKTVLDIAQTGAVNRIYSSVTVNIVIGALSVIISAIFMCLYNNEAKRGAVNIKKMVFAKAMKLPISYYDTHHSGELLSRLIYDSDTASGIYTSRLRRVIAPIITVVVYVIAMIALNPLMMLCLVALNILLFVINTSLSKPMKKIGKSMSKENAFMTEKLSNIIAGIETSKMYDTNETVTKQYINANDTYVKTQKKKMILGGVLESFNVGFDLLCAFMFLVVGIIFIQNKLTTIGEITAIYTMYGALSFRFLQLGKYYPELMNCIAYASRIFEFLDEAEEQDYVKYTNDTGNTNMATIDLSHRNAVEIDNVTFDYDESHKVLDDVAFSIPSGKNIALTGKSGCGKSTFAKLMLGFYPFKSGDIRFWGKSIKELGLENTRKLIAYVPQEPYLFEVSIKENIRYGRLNATDKEIVSAAKLANADAFIMKQKDGYGTMVQNRGQSLSGGERQRIAIARAILKNAPIMLFDEATSALDNESEKLIQDSMDKLKDQKTIITIAHRAATIKMADMEIGM